MKIIITMASITTLLVIAFLVSFNWSNAIDYTPVTQSMMPLGITWLIGVLALASLGGFVASFFEEK